MAKNLLYVSGLTLFMLIGGTGCTEWLDVKPESQIVLEDFWQSEEDVQSVLASCYRDLTRDEAIARMIVWGELRSDNMALGGSIPSWRYGIQQILEGNLSSSNAYCTWSSFYSVINDCNTVLHYAPFVIDRDENFTLADLHGVQAEALTLRALCYFYLVRAFNQVPWIEDASIDDTQNYSVGQSTEREVLDHIISDLLTAKQYAVSDYGKTAYNKGRVTIYTVNALLADVYLWDQQYDKCIAACDEVLANNQLKFVKRESMLSTVFSTGNSSESIFELQFNNNVQINNPVYEFYGYSSDPIGDLCLPNDLVYDPDVPQNPVIGPYSPFNYPVTGTLYESKNDIRAKDFVNTYIGAQSGVYFIFKYSGVMRTENTSGKSSYLYRSTTSNWIVYRLSDVVLMKAEALVEMGEQNFASAIQLLNQTYQRSNSSTETLMLENYSTKADMEDLVLRERQRELMFEGKRWFDLVRKAKREGLVSELNKYVNHKASSMGGVSLAISSLNGMYMPIPESELRINPKLKQNPYYEVSSSSSTK